MTNENKKETVPLIQKEIEELDLSSINGALSADECHKALTNMKSDKSLGSDGLPAEFYNHLWDEIGEALVEVLNFCFNKGLQLKLCI